MPDEAALLLARSLHEGGEVVGGVNGALPAARLIAEETVRLAGGSVVVDQYTRLFELRELAPPASPPGHLRLVEEDEAPLALNWFLAFHDDADEQAGRAPGDPPAFCTSTSTTCCAGSVSGVSTSGTTVGRSTSPATTSHPARAPGPRPDPGVRSHPARAADEERPGRHHDPRLQAQRHDDPVRRAQRARRVGHRPVHAAPPPPGIHPLPQPHRARRPGRQADPRRARQLRHPQAPQGPRLARAPRPLDLPLHPDLGSWLNAVEGFFAKLTRRRLQRGVFHSLVDLQAAINRYLAEHNQAPKPFVWTAEPEAILAKVKRGHQTLETIH